NLSVLHLAPGGEPGRLMVISQSALENISRKYEVLLL
ncbi:MAG: 50S ribosomal protein L4, partial [Desulfurococcaceae archaeon]